MAKTTVFIASKTEQENYILQKKLDALELEFLDIKFAGVHTAGLLTSVDRLTSAVIMNLNDWSPKEATLLRELRNKNYQGPILVCAKAEVRVIRELRNLREVVFLPKPFETKELLGIARKMLLARNISQQVHRRYLTTQDAEIEISGKIMTTRVKNLSKGGAFLEFLSASAPTVGEYVTVKLELKDLNRVYKMPAKIVWTQKHGNRGLGIGVEFTGQGEVQRSIIGF